MRTLLEYWTVVWTYKFSLFPVLATYFLFDSPALIRRVTRRAYIPIYFMFFPLGHSDRMYAEYFNEDDMYCVGESMTPAQKEALRTKIIWTAVISMIFATVLAPWLCGFVAAFYLTPGQFVEFVCFLMVVKTILILKSLYEVRRNASFIVRSNSFKFVVLVYLAYLALIYRGVTKAYWWTADNISTGGYLGVAQGLVEYAYTEVFINMIVVGLGTWALTYRSTDPGLIPERYVYEPEPERPAAAST